MKKIVPILVALLLFIVPMNAYAATRQISIRPTLAFDGTTANCKVLVVADSETDSIQVCVKLMQGSTCLATWNGSGSGFLNFSATKEVIKGKEYILSVEATIRGVKQPVVKISNVCK